MGKRCIALGFAVALALVMPSHAPAQTSTSTASVEASETYDLSFTLPTVGVSGCQVCHADPNLVKLEGGTTSSIYTDPEEFAQTAHATTQCTGCHADFAYKTPHDVAADSEEWRDTAKSSCKDCHTAPFKDVTNGAHSPATKPGEDASETAAARVAEGKPAETPLCGDCHGDHDIQYLDVERWDTTSTAEIAEMAEAGAKEMHGRGLEICGSCHTEYANEYADYYHGAAYQEGAPDAPSCWDCHGAHEVLPASDRRSTVHPNNLIETCGQCHDDVNEEYVKYAALVHQKEKVEDEIPIYAFYDSVRVAIDDVIATIGSWFGGSG